MKMKLGFIFLLFVFVVYGDNRDLAMTSDQKTFTPGDGPVINPMKGWSSSWWDDYAHASVGFQYVAWKAIEPQNNFFNFTAVEEIINRAGTKERHLILRLYADWGASDVVSKAGPSWLYKDLGVKYLFNIFNGNKSYLTDYNNPVYIAQAVELIQAFGKRYNNDPRIYAIELGLLGYWGEWHNHGYPTYTISDTAQHRILDAYLANFPNKLLMGRYPWKGPALNTSNKIGFHNDYFYPLNANSDGFDTSVDSGKKWMNGPIGGETPPDVYTPDTKKYKNYDALFKNGVGEKMIRKGRYSIMKFDNVCADRLKDLYCPNFMKLHRMIGYNYQLISGAFPNTIGNISSLRVRIKMKNIGVAPMYYNWKVEMALLNPALNNTVARVSLTNFTDIKSFLPQNERTYEVNFTNIATLKNIEYKLAIRISQPGADLAKTARWGLNPRNVYVEFANNNLPVVPASWNSNHALTGGWTILGSIKKT